MNWLHKFCAKKWSIEDLPSMMMKAFELMYDKSVKHGPFRLVFVDRKPNVIEVQFNSDWEDITAYYIFDYSEHPYIKISFVITKDNQSTPHINLSYPQVLLKMIPHELVKRTMEIVKEISPKNVTASTEEEGEDIKEWIRQFNEERYQKDIKRRFKQDPGEVVLQHYGVWTYPFNLVKKNSEGYYIDWFENPGSIRYLEKVQIGDKVADFALNMTPYWEVNFVDEDKGQIWLTPIDPNPYITGQGAGGAEWTSHDEEVSSGQYEDRRQNEIINAIRTKEIASPSDVKYLLKGTIPVHIGPNLSQGGWYSASDLSHNRGGREGLGFKDIQQADAIALSKLGFQVPQLALDGKMDPEVWSRFIDGSSIDPKDEETKFEQLKLPGENWNDLHSVINFILNNPVPEVKVRNWYVLKQMVNPFPVRKRKLDEGETYEDYYEKRQQLIDKWKNKEFLDKSKLPIIRDVCIKTSTIKHPRMKYDPYWLLKEKAMEFAQEYNWHDVLSLFVNDRDFNVRESLINVLERSKNVDLLVQMFESEDRASNMEKIVNALNKIYPNMQALIRDNADRIKMIIEKEKDGPYKYSAESLQRHLRWALKENNWLGKIIVGTKLPDDPERRKYTKWKLAPRLGSFLIGPAGAPHDICIYKVIKSTEVQQEEQSELISDQDLDEEKVPDKSSVGIPSLPGEESLAPLIDNINRMKDVINKGDASIRKGKFDPGKHVPVEIMDILISDKPNNYIRAFNIGDKKFILIGGTSTSFYKYVNGIGGLSHISKMRLLFGDIPRILQQRYPQLIGGDLSKLVPEYNTYSIGEYNVIIVKEPLFMETDHWAWYIPELHITSEHTKNQWAFDSQQTALEDAEQFIKQFSSAI